VIEDTFNNLGLNHDQSLIDFLKNISPVNQSLFSEAKKDIYDSTTGTFNALSVIARATLMLRVSSGTSKMILSAAGITKSDMDFLWEKYGVQNGFWMPGHTPVDFYDLWNDVQNEIFEFSDWASMEDPNLSLSGIYKDLEIPYSFNYFKQFHRAALWGMDL
jgi:hypothetical protein